MQCEDENQYEYLDTDFPKKIMSISIILQLLLNTIFYENTDCMNNTNQLFFLNTLYATMIAFYLKGVVYK